MFATFLFFVYSSWVIALSSGQSTCGVPEPGYVASPRIIGGQIATPSVSPWQLAIETDDGSEFTLHCGGVVISNEWALTAAHCVTPRPGGEELVAIAGLYNRTDTITGTQIRVLQPSHITFHPEFDPETLLNDLAILRFTPPLDLSTNRVKAICLPPSASTSYIENPNCYITGWGLTSAGGMQSNQMMRISTDVIQPLHCELRLDHLPLPTETCTFDEVSRSDTPCHGDMGGPLGCVFDGQFYLAGIGSYVDPDCNPRVGQIHSNIPVYVDWIRSVTGLP